MSCMEQSHVKRCRVAYAPIAAPGKMSAVLHTDCCAERCLCLHTEQSRRIAKNDKFSQALVSGMES